MTLSEYERRMVCFERGKVLDQLGQSDQAIAAFMEGNALAQRAWSTEHPEPNSFLAEVERLIELVSQGWLDDWNGQDTDDDADAPAAQVFLTGFPRSGTTLLGQILDANSRIRTLKEMPTVSRLRDIVDHMPGGYPQALMHFDHTDVAYLRHAYFDAIGSMSMNGHGEIVIDKMPLQMVRAALIQRVFPGSHYLFITRHPCDACLSCFMQDFDTADATANFFALDDTVRLYVRTMELWRSFREKLSLSVQTIRYEALVTDLETETRKACDFLGVPWQPRQANFAEHVLAGDGIQTPSYEQVSRPIYRDAVGRWEKYRAYLEPHLPALQPWIEYFG